MNRSLKGILFLLVPLSFQYTYVSMYISSYESPIKELCFQIFYDKS